MIKFDQFTSISALQQWQAARVHHQKLIRHGDGEIFNTGEIRKIISVIFSHIAHYQLPHTRYKNMPVSETKFCKNKRYDHIWEAVQMCKIFHWFKDLTRRGWIGSSPNTKEWFKYYFIDWILGTVLDCSTMFVVHIFIGDVHLCIRHLVIPALNLSTLNSGILITVHQVRLMMSGMCGHLDFIGP